MAHRKIIAVAGFCLGLSACGLTPSSDMPAPVYPASVMAVAPEPSAQWAPPAASAENRERFEPIETNPVKRVDEAPVSTFSVDVDTASYSFVRRRLNDGILPPADAVRIEEFVNYFDYAYPAPASRREPFATHVFVGDSPWRPGNKLLQIGIKGYEVDQRPRSNLVFLIDVSGSMASDDKLPLVKRAIGLLVDQLGAEDTVALVVYAGAAGTVLEPTPASDKTAILAALDRLEAGGSTAGAEGLDLAYRLAEQNADPKAVNRILLATDGDFNVGIADPEALKAYVQRKRETGIYLSVLGFGEGNYYDQLMQTLAQNGNGIAAYIDTLGEARKVLVTEARSSLFPIANDVKVQVDFNPATVAEYRLIGYETRALAREDFNNDRVDAGDIGAGHTVTALYEITPVGADSGRIEASRYTAKPAAGEPARLDEYALLRLRYKLPGDDQSRLIERIVPSANTVVGADWQRREFDFATAVAGFAQLLRGGKYTDEWTYDAVIEQALASRGDDAFGYRSEFVQLVRMAKLAKPM